MSVTVVGDFADPLSYLASQRVEQIRSLGLHTVEWLAVETDHLRPMTGTALTDAGAEQVRRLALRGEAVPDVGLLVPNSCAATAAYAESFTDEVPDAMRVALFDTLWARGENIADPEVIRSVAFNVFNPDPPAESIERRIRANTPIVPLGDADPIATTRRLGFIVSTGRGPLTLTGSRRVDTMRAFWQAHGGPETPLLVSEDGATRSGVRALRWLADQLPHHGVRTEARADRSHRVELGAERV